jgi:hypothetical protein
MIDPLHNPTPWLKIKLMKPKKSKYYLCEKKTDLALISYWDREGRKEFIRSLN